MKRIYSYLTNEEIHNLEVAIYNDDNEAFYKALPKVMDEDDIQEDFKEFLAIEEGVEYKQIPETLYVITSKGLVFHTRHKRPVRPAFSRNDFTLNLHGKSFLVSKIFKDFGWEFNHGEIVKFYKERGYDLHIPKLYKQLYESL